MRKYSTFILIFMAIPIITYAQLKMNSGGCIGFGIEPRNDYKLLIKGDILLTTFPEIPSNLTTFAEFKIKLGNGWPGCEMGTSARKIALWSTESGYNDLYAANYFTTSDRRLKSNIVPISNGIKMLMQLQPYSYFKSDTIAGKPLPNKEYGFLAQDVKKVMPELIDSAINGIMLLNYQQVIPILVAAVKEQQVLIDSLKQLYYSQKDLKSYDLAEPISDSIFLELDTLREQLVACCNQNVNKPMSLKLSNYSSSILLQNKPNPFFEKTSIEFNIIDNFYSASIMVFDMQGNLKKVIPILQKGKGQITINGFELSPGMYLYSLVIDSNEIDTKRMILID